MQARSGRYSAPASASACLEGQRTVRHAGVDRPLPAARRFPLFEVLPRRDQLAGNPAQLVDGGNLSDMRLRARAVQSPTARTPHVFIACCIVAPRAPTAPRSKAEHVELTDRSQTLGHFAASRRPRRRATPGLTWSTGRISRSRRDATARSGEARGRCPRQGPCNICVNRSEPRLCREIVTPRVDACMVVRGWRCRKAHYSRKDACVSPPSISARIRCT